MLALLATLFAAVPFALAAQEPASADIEASIAVSDPRLGERGPSTTIHHHVHASGTLHVWASSTAFDPFLHVELGAGRAAAEDDNWGGGTSAWIAAKVDAGDDVVIVVASNARDGAGTVHIGIRELPETDETRGAALEARTAIQESSELRAGEQKHDLARERLRNALEIVLATPGVASSADVVGAMLRLVTDAYRMNDFETCIRASRFRSEAMTRAWPSDCTVLQEARMQYGQFLVDAGKGAEGRALCEQALEVFRRTLGPNAPEAYTAMLAVGQSYYHDADFERAAELMRDAVTGLEHGASASDSLLSHARMLYASTLNEIGLPEEARVLQERALVDIQARYGPEDPIRLSAEGNLAVTLSGLGDHQAALALYERVLAVEAKIFAADDGDLLSMRMNVAVQLISLGQLERARDLLEEVVARAPHTSNWSTTSLIRARTNLAITYDDLHEFERALALLQPMVNEPEWKLEQDRDRLWRVLVESAVAYDGVGRGAESLAHAERALDVLVALDPPGAPDIFDTQNLVAKLMLKRGNPSRAHELATNAAQGSKEFFARCATTLATRQAAAVQLNWSRLVADGLVLLNAAAGDEHRERAVALALELVESARSVDGATMRLTRELAGGPAREEVEQRRTALRRIAREIVHCFGRAGAEEQLRAHFAEKEAEERALKALLARSAGSGPNLIDVDLRAIAAALPTDQAALSFWSYETRGDTLSQHVRREHALAAFVVRRDKAPLRIELGSVEELRQACELWRAALQGDDAAAARSAGTALAKRLIEPLRVALADTHVWHVALDDALHLVPLDALPEGDGCLGDRVRIIATPTLAELALPPIAGDDSQMLVALGGIDYDHEPDEHAPRKTLIAIAPTSTDGLRSGARGELAPLWETSQEIAAVAKLFKSRKTQASAAGSASTNTTVELLEERYATKSALFGLAPKARFLHIATHGFFAPESVPAIGERAAVIGFDPLASQDTMLSAAAFAPLALCGLALSGANLPTSDPHSDEAIATAEELASLDLSSCEMVVLSACDTNVGLMRAGQGIASFQKALQAAGARSVVTSLWKVRDEATRELMSDFYRALWVDGVKSKSEALWRAKCELRARRAPVRDWAAWVLSGEG